MTPEKTHTTPISIVLLEDNLAFLQLLRDGLTFAGYHVTASQSGKEGIRILRTSPTKPHIILCDFNLTDMTACDVLLATGEDAALRAIPVIIITGNAYTKGLCPGFENQIKAQLIKPFILDDLISTVEQVVAANI